MNRFCALVWFCWILSRFSNGQIQDPDGSGESDMFISSTVDPVFMQTDNAASVTDPDLPTPGIPDAPQTESPESESVTPILSPGLDDLESGDILAAEEKVLDALDEFSEDNPNDELASQVIGATLGGTDTDSEIVLNSPEEAQAYTNILSSAVAISTAETINELGGQIAGAMVSVIDSVPTDATQEEIHLIGKAALGVITDVQGKSTDASKAGDVFEARQNATKSLLGTTISTSTSSSTSNSSSFSLSFDLGDTSIDLVGDSSGGTNLGVKARNASLDIPSGDGGQLFVVSSDATNPIWWKESEESLNSGPTGGPYINLNAYSSDLAPADNSIEETDPTDFSIEPQDTSSFEGADTPVTLEVCLDGEVQAVEYVIDVINEDSGYNIKLTVEANRTLQVVVKRGEATTDTNAADFHFILDANDANETDNWAVSISRETPTFRTYDITLTNLELGSKYYMSMYDAEVVCAIVSSRRKRDTQSNVTSYEASPLSLNVGVTEMTCHAWDDEYEAWMSDADYCKFTTETRPNDVKFKSNQFGSFGVGLAVPPNTINFATVFDNIGEKLGENMHVLIFLSLMIVLYIIMIPVLRRIDKKDTERWLYRELALNPKYSTYTYYISVYTGYAKGAATQSRVFFLLAGENGDTGVQALTDGKQKEFQQGAIDNYTLRVGEHLGKLQSLWIWHDNSGPQDKDGWYLQKVFVSDEKDSYVFICEDWLSRDEGSGKLDKFLKPLAKGDGVASFLPSEARSKLFDDHMWLSFSSRPTISTFTRVQRWSCCFALLFLSMISNAMWYRSDDDNDTNTSDTLSIGPFEITVFQIYVSIMTSLTVLVPSLIIVLLFRNSRSRFNKKPMQFGQLPWWCIIIGWVLVGLSIVTSAFFCVLYSFEWGGEKSLGWLVSMILSTIQSIFVVDPLKVVILVIVYTLVLKKHPTQDDVFQESHPVEIDKSKIIIVPPPIVTKESLQQEKDLIKKAKTRKLELEKKKKMMKSVLIQCVILTIFVLLSYSNSNRLTYTLNTYLKTLYEFKHETTLTTSYLPRTMIHNYIDTQLLDNLYGRWKYNGDIMTRLDRKRMYDMVNLRMGPMRIQQIRHRDDSSIRCSSLLPENINIKDCTGSYSRSHIDTSSYTWAVQTPTYTASAYNHTPAYTILPILGALGSYPTGGYAAVLPSSLKGARAYAHLLRDEHWIDDHTRAVFIDFTLFNMNVNLFSKVRLMFEIPVYGGIQTQTTIDSVQLYNYTGPLAIFQIILELCTVIAIIYLSVKLVRGIVKERCTFWSSGWNIVLFLQCLTAYTTIGCYVGRMVMTIQTVEDVFNKKGEFVDFNPVISMAHSFTLTFGFLVFITTIQFLQILNCVQQFWLVAGTIKHAWSEFLTCMLALLIMMGTFTQVGVLYYANRVAQFRDLWQGFITLTTSLIGLFKYGDIGVSDFFGPIFFAAYNVAVVWILLALAIGVIQLACVQARLEIKRKQDQEDAIHVVWNSFKKMFGKTSNKTDVLGEKKKNKMAEGETSSKTRKLDDIKAKLIQDKGLAQNDLVVEILK